MKSKKLALLWQISIPSCKIVGDKHIRLLGWANVQRSGPNVIDKHIWLLGWANVERSGPNIIAPPEESLSDIRLGSSKKRKAQTSYFVDLYFYSKRWSRGYRCLWNRNSCPYKHDTDKLQFHKDENKIQLKKKNKGRNPNQTVDTLYVAHLFSLIFANNPLFRIS